MVFPWFSSWFSSWNIDQQLGTTGAFSAFSVRAELHLRTSSVARVQAASRVGIWIWLGTMWGPWGLWNVYLVISYILCYFDLLYYILDILYSFNIIYIIIIIIAIIIIIIDIDIIVLLLCISVMYYDDYYYCYYYYCFFFLCASLLLLFILLNNKYYLFFLLLLLLRVYIYIYIYIYVVYYLLLALITNIRPQFLWILPSSKVALVE